jgi:hypothetical protein
MKKIFIGLLTTCALVANAQDASEGGSGDLSFTSKNGHQVLPQAGDIGLGISATAPLNYLGNFIGSGSNANGTFGSTNQAGSYFNAGTTVFGKYFLSSNMAVRVRISSNGAKATNKAVVADDGKPLSTTVPVYDEQIVKSRGLVIGAGVEKRRGYGRLIGIYGAEAYLGANGTNITKYTYANEISAANQTPSDAFGGNNNEFVVDGIAANRTLSKKSSTAVGVGAQAFIGMEYFLAPRLSIGGEFNWGLYYRPNTQTSTTVEFYNANANKVEEYTQTIKQSKSIVSGTNTLGGSFNVMFYF